MNDIFSVLIPLLNANEDQVLLVEWLVKHGDLVSEGDPICEVETSKAATELLAEQSGVVFQLIPPSSDVHVGSRIGLIGPTLDKIQEFLDTEKTPNLESLTAEVPIPVSYTHLTLPTKA